MCNPGVDFFKNRIEKGIFDKLMKISRKQHFDLIAASLIKTLFEKHQKIVFVNLIATRIYKCLAENQNCTLIQRMYVIYYIP